MLREELESQVRNRYRQEGIEDDEVLQRGRHQRLLDFFESSIEVVFIHQGPDIVHHYKVLARMAVDDLYKYIESCRNGYQYTRTNVNFAINHILNYLHLKKKDDGSIT